MLDLRTLAKNALEKNPDSTALIIGTRLISYQEFDGMIQNHSDCLAAQGVGKGDRVGLLSHNHPDLAALLFAAWRIGAVVVPLNSRYQGPEVEFAIEHGTVRLLLIQDSLAQKLAGNFTPPECLEKVFTFDSTVKGIGTPWRAVLAEDHPLAPMNGPVEDDPAAIYYTSGSTSKPKGVTHTARSILETGRSRAETMQLKEDDLWLLSTQLVHVSASLGSLIPALCVGGTVVFLEEFSPEDWLAAFRTHTPTRSVILPSLLHDVLDCPALKNVDFTTIRSMECGGDFVTPDLYEAWGLVCSEPLTQMIGMTECEGYCLRHPGTELKRGSAGKPRVGVEVRVLDKTAHDVPVGEIGELCIRSRSMTIGYWEDPENTNATIRDGWLHSGDQGRIDEDGDLWFVGRLKEIIIKRGSNIAPGEVESVLDEHPDIAESAVVGTPPGKHGQRVVAFIEPEDGHQLDMNKASLWAAERIAEFKTPDEWILVDALPRNAVGKLDRAELHRRSKELFPDG
jgi:acyl-coenzyme A synthetase/AMP-(fatty) acid ligase